MPGRRASNGGDSTYAAAVTVVSFNLVNASQPVTVTADSVSRTYGASGTVSVSYAANWFHGSGHIYDNAFFHLFGLRAERRWLHTTPLTIDSSTGCRRVFIPLIVPVQLRPVAIRSPTSMADLPRHRTP